MLYEVITVYFTESLMPDAGSIVAALRSRTGVRDWIGTVGIGVLASYNFV